MLCTHLSSLSPSLHDGGSDARVPMMGAMRGHKQTSIISSRRSRLFFALCVRHANASAHANACAHAVPKGTIGRGFGLCCCVALNMRHCVLVN